MPPAGRGGAGNIEVIQAERASIASDIEANRSAVLNDDRDRTRSAKAHSQDAPYAHHSRGGAGNYYSPSNLRENGRFGDTTSPGSFPNMNYTARTPGRGGAGNYILGTAEDEATSRRAQDQEQRRSELEEEVRASVFEQLALPKKAKLAGLP